MTRDQVETAALIGGMGLIYGMFVVLGRQKKRQEAKSASADGPVGRSPCRPCKAKREAARRPAPPKPGRGHTGRHRRTGLSSLPR